MLTFGETGGGTGGSHSLIDHLNVTQLCNGGLGLGYGVTNRTLLTFRQAGFGTGGSNSGQSGFFMARGRNGLGVAVIAARAGIGPHAVLGTGGGGGHLGAVAVAQLGCCGLCNQNSAAAAAVLTFGETGGGAGGSHSLVDDLGVAQGRTLCHLTGGTGLRSSTGGSVPGMPLCGALGQTADCTGLGGGTAGSVPVMTANHHINGTHRRICTIIVAVQDLNGVSTGSAGGKGF